MKHITIKENEENKVTIEIDGFTPFEVLGLLRYHEQRISLLILQDNKGNNAKRKKIKSNPNE